ncbi:hypothetical protein LWH94_12670 [Marinobacter sp. G11]|jgi:hypothetical protein|uniref:hypothetical protein n=1 Tax=Marinobacter TaxID=2742 RepID=UPI000674479D|nr:MULTISPECIES: hypothetical protein [Marinobacter]MCE0760055.1 hypothetical protein [Marinobacter sp. G11]
MRQCPERSKEEIGLDVALKILAEWGCSEDQKLKVLGVGDKESVSEELSSDQVLRISHVLNIHAALRLQFENPANIYGFMSLANDHSLFGGKSPLEVLITDGSLDVMQRIQNYIELGAGW